MHFMWCGFLQAVLWVDFVFRMLWVWWVVCVLGHRLLGLYCFMFGLLGVVV